MNNKDFYKYALSKGVSSNLLDSYRSKMGYINPTIIEERPLNITQMDVFSKLIQERQIFLGTEIDADVANIINAQLLYLDSVGTEDITILVNSPGGVCYDGLAITDTMNYITSDVGTTCVGMAASMGAVILSCGEKGKRFALPHSRVMIHQPLGGASGQCSDIIIEAETFEKILADCDRNYWMIAEEAKEYGLIDDVIKKK